MSLGFAWLRLSEILLLDAFRAHGRNAKPTTTPMRRRAVKNPLFALDVWGEYCAKCVSTGTGPPHPRLRILGPPLDSALVLQVKAAAAKASAQASAATAAVGLANVYDEEKEPAAAYLGEVSHAECLRAIAEADAVANTSNSEGMSGALVEALAAGTNVMARAVEGNVALLDQGHATCVAGAEASDDESGPCRIACSGAILFESPTGFVAAVNRLRTDADAAAELAKRQFEYVNDRLSPAAEEQRYGELVASVLSRA